MTEADEFFEKTALNANEPVVAPVSDALDCLVYEGDSPEEGPFFDESFADQAEVLSPFDRENAVRRLKLAEDQFQRGQWHTLDDVMKMVRQQIL